MLPASKVSELEFSDLYLGHPSLGDRFVGEPAAGLNPLLVTSVLREDLDKLTAVCRETFVAQPAMKAFKVVYDGVSYRAHVMHTLGGLMFVLRRIAPTVRPLSELGVPHAYTRYLMTTELTGLLIVSGAAKSGKTTTASAIVKDRLEAYGGVAITGEDPVEMPLEGVHGKGICFQTAIARDSHGFADAIRDMNRCGARMLYIDEIRDAETAAEVLQESVNGHLIITTMRAENVIQTVAKLHALAMPVLSAASAQTLIADGLAAVLHLHRQDDPKSKLATEFVYFKDSPVIRTVLRNGRYEMLANDIKQQMTSMITASILPRHSGEY